MRTELSPKSKKSFAYSVFIMLVLCVFLLGYFFYFIPANKATIHNNGFLILKTIADNIQEKSSGRLAYYKNISIPTNQNDSAVKELLSRNKINIRDKNTRNEKLSINNPDLIDGSVSVGSGELIYAITNETYKYPLLFKEGMPDFLQSILVTQKEELFENYALAKVNDKSSQLLYHDPEFGIRTDVKLDSLLPKNVQAYLTGIRDIATQDFNHKMFYYPFTVDTTQLVLCGFVRTATYNEAMRKVPFSFVYPLAIAFLLLISLLPILKFYIMDSNEQVRVRDVVMFGLSVFIGAAALTLVITQYLLRKGEEDRISQNLKNVAAQIETNFYGELNEMYDQIGLLDNVRKKDPSLQGRINKEKNVDYSVDIRNYLQSGGNTSHYQFDRVSWLDSSGMQILKAEMNGKPVYANVKDRKYFQAFKNNNAYFLADTTGKSRKFGLEAIYSWTNGDFNVSMSRQEDKYIVVLATQMHSAVDALLPVGYKYCIIDEHGNVLMHADKNRNLRENLYEKATPAGKIREAVAARQQTDIADITMYNNKRHMMHIKPLKGLPYSLVAFYDKAHISPVNLRILIFSLIFFGFSALLCVVLWTILARGGFSKHRLLYCPMDCLLWLSPQKREAVYYRHGVLFLFIYLALFLAFIGLHRSFLITNYTVFSLVLFTPFNVICVLFSVRSGLTETANELEKNQQQKIKKKIVSTGLLHLLISIVFFAGSYKADFSINILFLFFQCAFSVWIWVYRFFKPGTPKIISKITADYKMGYSLTATFLVICLAVLPSGLYTWYAHNQEIIQSVKKQQLYLAKRIEQRIQAVANDPVLSDTATFPGNYIYKRIFKNGIYTLYSDNAFAEDDTTFDWQKKRHFHAERMDENASFERFYFEIADNAGNAYYDSQLYPSLTDYPGDSSWRWQVGSSMMDFYYYAPPQSGENINRTIHISSAMPQRFLFLSGPFLFLLLPLIAWLVYVMYRWLRVNTEYVFLIKYADTFRDNKGLGLAKLIDDYNKEQGTTASNPDDDIYSADAYSRYTKNTNADDLHLYEKEVLLTIDKGMNVYEYIWSKCAEKERYLLYDFAQDGLVNYKNTTEIYSLLHKGILIIDDEKMKLFSPAFRAYLITKANTEEVIKLHKKYHQNSTWQAVRKPLMLLLLGVAIFIFFTQEATFQKLLAIAGGVGTLISLIPKIFSTVASKAPETSSQ